MSKKEMFMSNDYCASLNDGFGCPELKNSDNIGCADCLSHVIRDMVNDLIMLLAEIEMEKDDL